MHRRRSGGRQASEIRCLPAWAAFTHTDVLPVLLIGTHLTLRGYGWSDEWVRNLMGNGEMAGSRPPRLRWIGGANLPTVGGWRVNATEFFAELLLDHNSVELRLRGPLRRLTRAETLLAEPADLSDAFPIRSRARFRGVGFRRSDGREYYFKTSQIDPILRALQDLGFPVSMIDQPAAKIWRLKP